MGFVHAAKTIWEYYLVKNQRSITTLRRRMELGIVTFMQLLVEKENHNNILYY